MPLTPPFTTAEYLAAVAPTFEMDVNAVREHAKPRASGLGSCARQQAYMMAGVARDPIGVEGSARSSDLDLTTEQGRMFEDLSVQVIENIPGKALRVEGRQLALPPDYPVTGHPDGELGTIGQLVGLNDGLRWGFEHKHLGRWAYESILKSTLYAAEPGYVLQSALYGDALGWDAAQFVIVSQDSSSVRGDMTANLRAKNPATRWAVDPSLHPKVHIVSLDLRPVKHGLVPMALERARWLSAWKANDGDPAHVAREYDADKREMKWVRDGEGGRMEIEQAPFPCGWCPYLEACGKAGAGGKAAPVLPWTEARGEDAD